MMAMRTGRMIDIVEAPAGCPRRDGHGMKGRGSGQMMLAIASAPGRLAPRAMAIGVSARGRWMRLDPPARAVGPPVATAVEVAVTEDVLGTGFHPAQSRAVVRVWLDNASPRPSRLRLEGARFELRDLAGAPAFGSYVRSAEL